MITGNRIRTTLILATIAMLIAMSAVPTQATFIAYHDFGATTGEESTGNITTHQSGTGSAVELDTSPKELINYADGSPTGVFFSVDGANAMDARNAGQTSPPDVGTPADPLFNVPGLNLSNGVVYEGGDGGEDATTYTLTGLNPAGLYDIAFYGNRNAGADGVERFTLGGADSAVNSSSTGIISDFVTDMETRPNQTAGNVVRWTEIDPGADGEITITVDPEVTSPSNIAYLSAMRLEGGIPTFAFSPNPGDGATNVLPDTDLGWSPGTYAVTHDVYLGTSFEDVNTATLGDDAFRVNQTANTFDPGVLDYDMTYFWRIDEINDAEANSPWKGQTWSFATESYLFTLPAAYIDVDAYSYDSNDTRPENTINGSGLDESGLLHSKAEGTMWVTAVDGPQPAWIEFTFDKDYALYEMDVWNHNGLLGIFGIQEALIETSTNGGQYTPLGTYTFTQAPGADGYAANTTVDLGGLIAGKVRITAQSGYLNASNAGLSEVRFRYLPVRAYDLTLANDTAGLPVDETLGWRAGRQAVGHEICVGTDVNDLPVMDMVSDTQYNFESLDLTLGQTYYYQIVEVNEAETPARWATDPMSFTVVKTLVVDDMESYNDLSEDAESSRRVYNIWTDGYNDDTNGSQLGRPEDPLTAPFVEQTLVKSGKQAMSLLYDNSTAPKSEVTATTAALGVVSDWTSNGIKSLSLMFHGNPGNTGQLYVKINNTKVPYDGDVAGIARVEWQAWIIDLSAVGGNLQNVTSLTIGVEDAGAAGVLYIDEIRLYPKAAAYFTPVEPDADNLVGHWDFDEGSGATAADVSGNGNHGTLVNTTWQAGKMGSALKFDGLSAYVDIPGAAWSTISQQVTVSLWLHIDSSAIQTPHTFSAFSNETKVASAYVVWNNGNIYFDSAINRISKGVQPAEYADAWIHWAFVKNADTGEQKIYRNGILWHSATGMTSPMAGGSVARFTLGTHANHEDNPNNFWNGVMDDFRLYNKELSQEEILWLANRTEPLVKPF